MGAFSFSVALVAGQKFFVNYLMHRNMYKGLHTWPLHIAVWTGIFSFLNYRIQYKKESELVDLEMEYIMRDIYKLDSLGIGQFKDKEEEVKRTISRFQAN